MLPGSALGTAVLHGGVPFWLNPAVVGRGMGLAFDLGQYWLGNGPVSQSALLADARNSNALLDNTAAVYSIFGPNVSAITDRGLYAGGQVVSPAPSGTDLMGAGWTSNLSPVITDVGGPALGIFNLVSVASTTSPNDMRRRTFDVTSGTKYWRRIRYRIGTSGQIRAFLRFTSPSSSAEVSGPPVSLSVVYSGSGATLLPISAVSNTLLPDGVTYELLFSFTPGQTASLICDIGPNSANGTNTIVLGDDVVASAFPTPWVSASSPAPITRLADNLTIPDFSTKAAQFGFASGFAGEAIVDLTRLDGTARMIYSAGTGSDNYTQLRTTTANEITMVARAGGGAPVILATSAPLISTGLKKIEFAFLPAGGGYLKVTGLSPVTGLGTFTMPPLNVGQIGAVIGSVGSHFNDPIPRLQLWGA